MTFTSELDYHLYRMARLLEECLNLGPLQAASAKPRAITFTIKM